MHSYTKVDNLVVHAMCFSSQTRWQDLCEDRNRTRTIERVPVPRSTCIWMVPLFCM